MSLPYQSFYTGVSGYSASDKAAIVIKNGWIVGEYYNQASAATDVYYLASNGKTFTILLAGRMAQDYPQLGFGLDSKLYDPRWLSQGFPLTDARKADITFDQVFRHTSGIIPEVEATIASGAVQPGSNWNFVEATVGKDSDYPETAPLYFVPGVPSTYTKGSTYSSVAANHFSLVFRNVTGLEASVYLRQGLLDPIGVGRMAYKLTPGMSDYIWATAGNGLASARDFARLGYLMLHEGEWAGTRLFAASWLQNFTTSPAYRNIHSNVDCSWGNKFPSDMYRTAGSGQNWALVVPSLDLVLTFTGRTPTSYATAIDTTSLNKLFAAVTERYVACDGTVFNDTPPPSNAPPSASFSSSCSGLDCTFTDTSSDPDGTVASWSWSFGDGGTSTETNPSHAYAEIGTYTGMLTVTDDQGATGSTLREVSTTGANIPPTAVFSSSCSGLPCTFTDASTDADGSVTGWSWTFGDGGTSTETNPSHAYAAGGTYTVTLTVTDDGGATRQQTAQVTVSSPSAISLTATGKEDATKQSMILRWTGAQGTTVDIYRDGAFIKNTPNDGRQTVTKKGTSPATFILKVCEGQTLTCSNQVSLVFQ
jgi:PKD repeat protein